jgi:hypothetical protein
MKKTLLYLAASTTILLSACNSTGDKNQKMSSSESSTTSTSSEMIDSSNQETGAKAKDLDSFLSKGNSVETIKTPVDNILFDYLKTFNNDKFKVVSADDYEKNKNKYHDDYDKGILTYYYAQNSVSEGDLNKDGQKDFIHSYYLENCWGGIGANNIVSDFAFIISDKGGYKVNTELTESFKMQLEKLVNADKYGKLQVSNNNGVKFISYVEFKNIIGSTTNGDLKLLLENRESEQEMLTGNFTFDFSSKTLNISNLKKE